MVVALWVRKGDILEASGGGKAWESLGWMVHKSYSMGDGERVSLWKGIRRGWDHFSTFLSFSVGDGERVNF